MPIVFSSYTKVDRARARSIAGLLESCGYSVFRDHTITMGEDWRQVVQSELDSAGVVVVLWPHSSVASTRVHDEAERGQTRLISGS